MITVPEYYGLVILSIIGICLWIGYDYGFHRGLQNEKRARK